MNPKYIDTVTENIERLKDARKHINIGVFVMSVLSILCMMFFVTIPTDFGLVFFLLAIYSIVVTACLVIKREIYSVMIFLREKG